MPVNITWPESEDVVEPWELHRLRRQREEPANAAAFHIQTTRQALSNLSMVADVRAKDVQACRRALEALQRRYEADLSKETAK